MAIKIIRFVLLNFIFCRTMSKTVFKWIVPYVTQEENNYLPSYRKNTAKNMRNINPKLRQTKKYLANQFDVLRKSTLQHMKTNICQVITEILPEICEKVTKNYLKRITSFSKFRENIINRSVLQRKHNLMCVLI